MKRSLPLRITLALSVVLITTLWCFTRAVTGFLWSGLLATYAKIPGPWYIGLTGAVFGLVGACILWAFWRRKDWAPVALVGGTWAYVAWSWADRLMFQSQARANWPFAAVVTAVILVWMTAVALDRRNRAYFRKEANGRQFRNY
jgi:hypothetical protein